MVRFTNYTHIEIMQMMPYEIDIFASLEIKQRKKESEARKQQ